MIGWDLDRELHQDYAPPYRDPFPDYVKLHEEMPSLEAQGSGRLETEDQTCILECSGKVTWNHEKIDGKLVSHDPERFKTLELHNSQKWVRIHMATEDGRSVLVDGGKISHLETSFVSQTPGGPPQNVEIPFGIFALKVLVERGL